MSSRLSAVALIALGIALTVLPARAPTRACAPVTGKGEHVAVASESALIVWDEKAKKQHFIRRASFDTKVPYFGFLVPTPTRPELAEAPDELFSLLEGWTRPETKTETVYEEFGLMSAKLSEPLGGAVTVLDQQRVAGYDAVVLKATDAEALRAWLQEHGYDARPALTAWLEPYVKAGWVLTAFQIAKTDGTPNYFSTQAVRMSFATERPFFPYSEPPDQRQGENVFVGRFLRVFVVASQRMQGEMDDPKSPWSGKAVWAGPLGEDRRSALRDRLDGRAVPLPEGAWLTVFDDPASPRPGTADVFFSPSADQSELRRPPIINYRVIYYPPPGLAVVITLIVGLSALLVWCAIRLRRRVA